MKLILDGVDVSPIGLDDIEISIDKSNIEDLVNVGTDKLVFVNEAVDIIKNHLNTKGAFKGIPLTLQLNNGFQLPYYLDLTSDTRFQDHKIEAGIQRRFDNHRMWEQFDATAYDILASLGVTFNHKQVPRFVYRTDIETQTVGLANLAYQLTLTSIDLIAEYSNAIASTAAAIGAGLSLAPIIYAAAMLVLLTIKILLVLAAIKKLFESLVRLYFPQVDFLPAPQIKSLLVNSAAHFGYTITSDLLERIEDWYYLGRPMSRVPQGLLQSAYQQQPKPTTLTYPTASDRFEGMTNDVTTVGGFWRWFLETTNSRVQVIGTTIFLERRDIKIGVTNGVTTGLTVQSDGVNEYTINTEEAWSRMLVVLPIDSSDIYTSDLFDSSVVEYATVNIDTSTPDLDIIRGIRRINTGLSLGYPKVAETFLEQFLKSDITDAVQKIFNILIKASGSSSIITNALSSINNSIGKKSYSLITSDYFFDRPKLLSLNPNGSINTNWVNSIGAEALFNHYHSIDFIGSNDFEIHTAEIMECTNEIFVNLLNNDFADINGEVCEVLSVKYNEYANRAEISYKKPSDYAKTVKLVKVA